MKKRTFLTELNIWGAMLVSHGDALLYYSIDCLLKYCDYILLMQDNTSEQTRAILAKYKARYPDRIYLAETGFPSATEGQNSRPQGQLRRFKGIQGPCRERVFEYLRNIHKKTRIDILLFPDEDEVFSDYLPELLEEFWSKKEMRGITIKPIDVYSDMKTVTGRSMTGHTRILKFFPELTGLDYRTGCCYRPLTKRDRMGCKFYTIHLCNLKTDRYDWRIQHWKKGPGLDWGLWKLPDDARKVHPSEIKRIIKKEQDLTVAEYISAGEKWQPMGEENANKALKEASDMLDEMGLRHGLLFGTALRLYRDKRIGKDWDIDAYILGEDLDKVDIGLLMVKLAEKGFHSTKIKRDIPKWKKSETDFSDENYIRTISFVKYGCRIDLDPVYLSADGKSRIGLKGRKRQRFAFIHPREWFEDTDKVEHQDKLYNIPTPVYSYFESNYGKNWNTPVHEHRSWRKRACMSQTYECK